MQVGYKERGAGVIARDTVAAGVEVVLVGGGDGTVREVARELVYKPGNLGILPIGIFNNIARSIGVPAELPVADAQRDNVAGERTGPVGSVQPNMRPDGHQGLS